MATKKLTDLLSRQVGKSASHFGLLSHSGPSCLVTNHGHPLGHTPATSLLCRVGSGESNWNIPECVSCVSLCLNHKMDKRIIKYSIHARHLPPPPKKKTLPLKRTQQVQGCKKKAPLFSDCWNNNFRGYISFNKGLMIVLAAGTSHASSTDSRISQRQDPAGT